MFFFVLLPAVYVNESCIFNEQCEDMTPETACIDGKCICRFDKMPITKKDNSIECVGERPNRKQSIVLVFNNTKYFSYQGKGYVNAFTSQSSNVSDSHRYGSDVHYYLRCSTPVQQVSTE
jgi:hypothetical protein